MRERLIRFLTSAYEGVDDWDQYTNEQLMTQVMFTCENQSTEIKNLRNKLYLAEWKLGAAQREVAKLQDILSREE